MAKLVKQTVTTPATNRGVVIPPVQQKVSNTQTTENVIYFFFGIVEVLLAFRLIFKLLGASTASAFVRMIYSITGIFIYPFEGIFHKEFAQGVETASVLEPSTVVAVIVYVILAWGIVKLVRILSQQQEVS